uniref:Lipocalin/cytosolic fatty-acid binding domain-containing protein n=1 Tax=Sinocyclocheilus anshuiensis TaxID=1608454 RepID=A0A671QFX8_9TELE
MPVDFTGKWELESSENLENYLKALDIDFAIRKIADGDNFVIKTQSAFKSYELSFTIGVEKEELTKGFDKRMLKVYIQVHLNQLECHGKVHLFQ